MKTITILLATAALSSGAVVHVQPGVVTLTQSAAFQLIPEMANGPDFAITWKAGEWLFERPLSGNKNAQIITAGNYLALLAAGDIVTSEVMWENHGYLGGEWKPGVSGFLGILCNPEDDGDPTLYHAGWLRMAWQADGSLAFYDWAYEDTDGASIIVGAIPEVRTSYFVFATIVLLLCLRRTRTN